MSISIIIPLFNEEKSLQELYRRLTKMLDAGELFYEIIFINDGSFDHSLQILEDIHQKDPRVVIISFRRNFGKSSALAAGFQEARGDIIITLDADLQDQPEEIPKFLEKIYQGYDLVSGWKKQRNDPFTKVIASRIFNSFVSIVSGLHLHDINCGFKAYRLQAVLELELYGEMHRFLPIFIHRKGFKVIEIPISHSPRQHGKSKFGPIRYMHGIIDLLTVIFLSKYIERPAHFFGSLGVISFFIGISISLYLTVLWFLELGPIGNRPLFFLGILCIIVSLQLISMGLLGEILVHKNPETLYRIHKKFDRRK